jgi:TRAP-type C4-dicarboxylate transport system substrate-binding protein
VSARAIVAGALALAWAWAWPAAAQELPPGPRVTVTAVTQLTPTLPQYTRVEIPILREAVPRRSGGRVEFNLASHPEKNVNAAEVIRLVRSGQVDIGGAPLTTASGDVPLLDGFDLPGLNPTIEQARKVADALVPVANQQLERLGVKIIATFTYPAQVFYCRRPVASTADFKGLRIRSPGPSIGDFLTAYGAQAVSLTFGEVYTALERGTVDCAPTGTTTGSTAKWWEVSSHLYTLPIAWGTSGYFVNLAWWNKLDPAVRAFIEKTMVEVQEAQWKLGAEATLDGIACNVGDAAGCRIGTLATRKMTEAKPSDADLAGVRRVLRESVLPNWVKRGGAQCGEIYEKTVAPITGVRIGG